MPPKQSALSSNQFVKKRHTIKRNYEPILPRDPYFTKAPRNDSSHRYYDGITGWKPQDDGAMTGRFFLPEIDKAIRLNKPKRDQLFLKFMLKKHTDLPDELIKEINENVFQK